MLIMLVLPLDGERVKPYLDLLDSVQGGRKGNATAEPEVPAAEGEAPMDTSA